MKKLLFSAVFLVGLGSAQVAQAQAALVSLISTGIRLGVMAATQPKLTPEQKAAKKAADKAAADKAVADQEAAEHSPVALAAPAAPTELVMHRTPADKLPKKAAAQITDLEAQLDRCHAAMLATPAGPVCTAEQRAAIQAAAISVARAKPGFDLHPYQQEMAYYMAEDARRQPAPTPAAPAN